MSIHTIIDICKTLTKEGKKPSTALVKNKLKNPLPLAMIMKGIQMYVADPKVEIEPMPIKEDEVCEACPCAHEWRVLFGQMQSQMHTLQNEVKALQVQVKALSAT